MALRCKCHDLPPPERAAVPRVLELLGRTELLCLGTTKEGMPLHPLRLRADIEPRPWRLP